MNFLAELSPAETLLILLGRDADFMDLMRVTLIDLIRKGVLSLEEVSRQPNRRDKVRYYKYVLPGKNFVSYTPLTHEIIFLNAFEDDFTESILIRNFIKLAFDQINSSGIYRSKIIKNTKIHNYFHQNLLQKWLGYFSLTTEGLVFKQKLQQAFKTVEDALIENLETNPEKAANIIDEIGGNIFLIGGIDFALTHQIDQELLIEMDHNQNEFSNMFSVFKDWRIQ